MTLEQLSKALEKVRAMQDEEQSEQKAKTLEFVIEKGVALVKRLDEQDEKKRAFTILVDLHKEAADDRATLAFLYAFGKKAGALRQLNIDAALT